MRFKLTLVLLLANLAVFFVLWRLEQPAAMAPKTPGPIARDMMPDHILVEDHINNQIREFRRDPNDDQKWNIIQPIKWPANGLALRAIYTGLQQLDIEISFSKDELAKGGQSLKDFGLDNPVLKVTLQDSARKQELWVGSSTARAGRLYVMNPEDGLVRVVAQGAIANLYAPLEDLRDNRLFSTHFYDAQSVSIWTGANKLVRFAKENDQWQLDAPLRRPADTDKVNAVVGQLGNLTVVNFVAPADADAAGKSLANPKLKIELKGLTSQTLLIGDDVPNAPKPLLYAQMEDNPLIFTIEKSDLFDTLLQAQDKLRQRQFLDFDPGKVLAVNFGSASGEIRLERVDPRTWQIHSKDSAGTAQPIFDADPAAMQSLLDSLHKLIAKNFAGETPGVLAPFGLDQPLWKIVLQADKPLALDLGRHGDGDNGGPPYRYYAKVKDADTVYEIDAEILALFDTNPLYYRDRVLEKLPPAAVITSLKLTHLTDQKDVFNLTLPDNKTKWEDFLRSQPDLLRSSLLTLRDTVQTFKVQDYRQAAFTQNYQIPAEIPLSVPWRYQLDAGVEIPAVGQTPAQKQTFTFYFSDLFATADRQIQIGGYSGDATGTSAIFDLTVPLMGALGILTEEASRPPEVQKTLNELNQPVNPRPPTAPAPTPAPAPAAATETAPPASPAPAPAVPAGTTP